MVSGTSCFGISTQTQALEPGGGVTVITLHEKEEKIFGGEKELSKIFSKNVERMWFLRELQGIAYLLLVPPTPVESVAGNALSSPTSSLILFFPRAACDCLSNSQIRENMGDHCL